jgi:hypothetical protein
MAQTITELLTLISVKKLLLLFILAFMSTAQAASLLNNTVLSVNDNKLYYDGTNLGINKSSPVTKLDVDGTAIFRKNASYYTMNTTTVSSGEYLISWDNSNIQKIELDTTATVTLKLKALSINNKYTNLLLVIDHKIDGTNASIVGDDGISVKWPGGISDPVLTASIGVIDIISFYYSNGSYFGLPMSNFHYGI